MITTKPRGYKVEPQSKKTLEAEASQLYQLLEDTGYAKDGRVNAPAILEHVFPVLGLQLKIIDKSELKDIAAYVSPFEGLIVVRSDIYDDLYNDDGRARFTIMHEISHMILDHHITLHRDAEVGNHKHFEDSEWQADYLSAATMMPIHIVKKYFNNPIGLAKHCGCSIRSAEIRIANVKKSSK